MQPFFMLTDEAEAEDYLEKWFFWATHAKLPAMADAAWTVKPHWNGGLHFIQSRITNGMTGGHQQQNPRGRQTGLRLQDLRELSHYHLPYCG
jgi:hypothetical protein